MTILMIILSIFMIICGVDCIMTPTQAFSALGWIAGVAVVAAGVAAVCRYASGRSNRSVWDLIGGIAGILLGLFITVNSVAHFAANMVIAYAVAIWLVLYGIGDIFKSVSLRKLNQRVPDEFRTAGWLVVMVLGILTVILGVACMIQPKITIVSVGLLMGVSILISGIKTLVLALQIAKVR